MHLVIYTCDEAVARAVESLWKKRFVADAPIPPQTCKVLYQCCMGQDCPSVLLYMMHSNNNNILTGKLYSLTPGT